ncbi:hypothetical protein BDQ17DRAFT_1343181 [Cyathus striatus]|nr:hypothetical protein BDQ17DRAFT_1343181 [Cyathus striatus]
MQPLIDLYLSKQGTASEQPEVSDTDFTLNALDITTELTTLPGIGSRTAHTLIKNGCRGIADLKASPKLLDMLSPVQRLRLTTLDYPHANRSEAESVMAFMAKSLPPNYDMLLVGDYRRGAKEFLDIEVLLTRPDFVYVPKPAPPTRTSPEIRVKSIRKSAVKSYLVLTQKERQSPLHKEVTPQLEERGLIAKHLNARGNVWEGVVRLPDKKPLSMLQTQKAIKAKEGTYRKLVIRIVSPKSFGAAVIQFTGDKEFIRDIRMKASRLGLYLDEFGLWRWQEGEKEGQGFWKMIKAHTEDEIFETLGTPFVAPERRNFVNIVERPKRRKGVS